MNPGAKAKGLAEKIQAALVGVGFTNRGVKSANFHVLRETKAPAVLVEVGFIDNTGDNQLFDTERDEIIAVITEQSYPSWESNISHPLYHPSRNQPNLYR